MLQKLEMWIRNCLYKMDFCQFQGFQGRPRFFHITPLQNGSLYSWGLALFQVAILLKCVLMSGSPLCRGQWFWKSQKCTKKKGWVPWFCRENPLLDLRQVPHSVEPWCILCDVFLCDVLVCDVLLRDVLFCGVLLRVLLRAVFFTWCLVMWCNAASCIVVWYIIVVWCIVA
jgi:hypothetical protein